MSNTDPKWPTYEVTAKPWFGPRARARRKLERFRVDVVDPADFIEICHSIDPELANAIEHVRFVDYRNRRDGIRYTIAVCWLHNDPTARDRVFDLADGIVSRTGWYPLPQGSRLKSVELARSFSANIGSRTPSSAPRGQISGLEPAVDPNGGCSVRVCWSSGDSLLLDSGLPEALVALPSDKVALISHAHADHSGGLTTGRLASIEALATAVTVRLLANGGWISLTDLANTVRTIEPQEWVQLGTDCEVLAFPVPHYPGAVGWIVRDSRSAVVFTGDISLRTARHDFVDELAGILAAQGSRTVTLLLDATMAGRPNGASTEPAADRVLSTGGDLVIVADSGEQLLYAYLDLFHTVASGPLRHTVSFVMSAAARPLFQVLHEAYIRREPTRLDPFILDQYGTTMTSWGESRWLFWLDQLSRRPSGRTAWLIGSSEVDLLPRDVDGTTIKIGRAGPDTELEHAIDTSPWTLHSNEETLIDASRRFERMPDVRVVWFHNFPKRMLKCIRANGLGVEPLTGHFEID